MRRTLIFLVLVAVAALAVPTAAGARSSADRNHDGLPDRWEHKNHLSTKVNQARKDQDRDRFNNKQEFEHGTNPRKADTDDDGIKDADEHRFGHDPRKGDDDNDGVRDGEETVGTIASFTNGTLTITKLDGTPVSGQVTPATEIRCRAPEDEDENEHEARVASHGSDDGADHDAGDNNDGDNGGGAVACGQDALVAGTLVHEAELENGVFTKVDVIKK